MRKLIPEQIELYNAELDRLSDEPLSEEIQKKQHDIAHILCMHYEGKPLPELVAPLHPMQKSLKRVHCEAEDTCKADCYDCLFGQDKNEF